MMRYPFVAIEESEIPDAVNPLFSHLLTTYVSETNKTASMWRAVRDGPAPANPIRGISAPPPLPAGARGISTSLLDFRPHDEVNTIRQILEHQLLSERRFFAIFVGTEEPDAGTCLPPDGHTVDAYVARYVELARARLPQLANGDEAWWMEERPFFDGLQRQRIWIFWRRVLHTCHHRTQVQTWLRLAGAHVPAIYGPSGDVRGDGDDPTTTIEAASRP